MKLLCLVLALMTGVLLGAIFFGGLWWTVRKGVLVQTAGALVLRQPVAANERCPGWFLFHRARSLGEAAGVPSWICHGALDRDAAHPSGGKANSLGTGGQPCALVPTR